MSAHGSSESGWFDARLNLDRFSRKYLRKAFPVHSTFFLGEIALFSFIILVITGLYLAFLYEPSTQLVEFNGEQVPAAYVSVMRINDTPFGLIVRRVHHWSAHIMIVAAILHLMRIFFTGTYKRPRELNWVVGFLLLMVTVVASFVGYLLPFDEFSVTATTIGYGITRSVPWIGPAFADFVFAGKFPAPGTIPRFFAYHVILMPLIIIGLLTVHMLILLKQKHSEPPYARAKTQGTKLIGVPAWPQQTALMAALFLFLVGGVLLISGFLPVHPVELYGPPRPGTPVVKPDWYFLWVFGVLKLIPGWMEFRFLGTTIGPEAIGGVLFPGLVILLLLLIPFIDRADTPKYYMDDPLRIPLRTAIGIGMSVLLLVLSLAGYKEEVGLSSTVLRIIAVVAPVAVGLISYGLLRGLKRTGRKHQGG
ncbi:MAG: cytochrome bc complex cytochrome b subunit [Candidatus Bipolaricaulia bacterium]